MVFSQAKKVEIAVILEGGELRDGLMHYSPGAEVSGQVRILSQDDIAFNRLTIALAWHTEGKGDRDREAVAEEHIPQGSMTAGIPFTIPFRLKLPDRPWSYAGHLITIIWAVEVSIDVAQKLRHISYSQPLVMSPLPGRSVDRRE